FGAAERDTAEEFTVGQVRQAVFESIHAHEALGTRIVWRDLVVGDRPFLEVDWSEAEAVSSPAEGPTAKGSQLPMAWTIAHPGEVVAIREVGDAKERRPAGAEATVELVVDHAV